MIFEIISLGSLANLLTDTQGATVTGQNRQRIGSVTAHPIFVSECLVAGAHPGVEIFVPATKIENDFVVGGGRHAGIGDVTVAPFLQWSSEPRAGAISARVALQVVAPTGDYVPGRPVNTGQGGWQLSPYLAATWRTSDRWEVSARAIYNWSGSSESRTTEGVPIQVSPGDLVAFNVSTSYALNDVVRLGIGGYALRQLRNSSAAGLSLPGSRAQVFGVGPVSRIEIGKAALLLAAFGEFAGHNRPEGMTLNVRIDESF